MLDVKKILDILNTQANVTADVRDAACGTDGGRIDNPLSELLEMLAGGNDTEAKQVKHIAKLSAEGVAKMVGASLRAMVAVGDSHPDASALYITKEAAVGAIAMVAMACIPEASGADTTPENDKIIDAKMNHNALLYAALVTAASESIMDDSPMNKEKAGNYNPHDVANEQFRTLTGRYFEDTLTVNCTCDKCKAKLAERRKFNAEAERAAAFRSAQ